MGTSAFQFQIDYNPDEGFDPFNGTGGGGGAPPPVSTQFDICQCVQNRCSTGCTFANQFCYYDQECEPDVVPPVAPPVVPPFIPPAVPPTIPPVAPPVAPPPVAPPVVPPVVPPQAQPPAAPLPPTAVPVLTTVFVQEAANGTAAIIQGVPTGEYGRDVIVRAYPNAGYQFVRWDIQETAVTVPTPPPVTPPPVTPPPRTPPPITPPPINCAARDTVLSDICDGCTKRIVYADGFCGTYQRNIANSTLCCPTAPPITPPPITTPPPVTPPPVVVIAPFALQQCGGSTFGVCPDGFSCVGQQIGGSGLGFFGQFTIEFSCQPITPPPVVPPPIAPPPVAPPPAAQRGGGPGICGECSSDSDCFFRPDGSFDPSRICDPNTFCCTSGTINLT
jgi:hypothetical protein